MEEDVARGCCIYCLGKFHTPGIKTIPVELPHSLEVTNPQISVEQQIPLNLARVREELGFLSNLERVEREKVERKHNILEKVEKCRELLDSLDAPDWYAKDTNNKLELISNEVANNTNKQEENKLSFLEDQVDKLLETLGQGADKLIYSLDFTI